LIKGHGEQDRYWNGIITAANSSKMFKVTLADLLKVCQKLRKYEKVCQKLRKYEPMHQKMRKYERSVPKAEKVEQSVPKA